MRRITLEEEPFGFDPAEEEVDPYAHCVICQGCGQLIDPETCWCGEEITHWPEGHLPRPMGCDCGRIKNVERVENNRWS